MASKKNDFASIRFDIMKEAIDWNYLFVLNKMIRLLDMMMNGAHAPAGDHSAGGGDHKMRTDSTR